MSRRLAIVATLLACLVPAIAAPPARAVDPRLLAELYLDYQHYGYIHACLYPLSALQDARNSIPNDLKQYAPDFQSAIDAAIQQQTSGACDKAAATGTPPPPPPGFTAPPPSSGGGPAPPIPTFKTTVPQAPSPPQGGRPLVSGPNSTIVPFQDVSATTGNGSAPAPLVALAVLAAALALGLAGLALGRRLGWGSGRLAPVRHAFSEAGYRAGHTWAELGDFLRFGR